MFGREEHRYFATQLGAALRDIDALRDRLTGLARELGDDCGADGAPGALGALAAADVWAFGARAQVRNALTRLPMTDSEATEALRLSFHS